MELITIPLTFSIIRKLIKQINFDDSKKVKLFSDTDDC